MPRLPTLSGQQVVETLRRRGFEQVRPRGSHVVMRRADVGCIVPLHHELKVGTPAVVLRRAGRTADAFLAALQ